MKVLEKEFVTDDWGSVSWKKFDKNTYKIFSATDVETGEKVKFYDLPFHLYLPKKKTTYRVEYGVK
jgi:hypothetical protein